MTKLCALFLFFLSAGVWAQKQIAPKTPVAVTGRLKVKLALAPTVILPAKDKWIFTLTQPGKVVFSYSWLFDHENEATPETKEADDSKESYLPISSEIANRVRNRTGLFSDQGLIVFSPSDGKSWKLGKPELRGIDKASVDKKDVVLELPKSSVDCKGCIVTGANRSLFKEAFQSVQLREMPKDIKPAELGIQLEPNQTGVFKYAKLRAGSDLVVASTYTYGEQANCGDPGYGITREMFVRTAGKWYSADVHDGEWAIYTQDYKESKIAGKLGIIEVSSAIGAANKDVIQIEGNYFFVSPDGVSMRVQAGPELPASCGC